MNTEKIGVYEIIQEIGRGGMGIVYKAHDPRLKRTVALKMLPPELTFDRSFVERFLAEARSAAALEHPNVVTIHGADEDQGRYFFVMQYIDGCSLADLLERRGLLDLDEALPILEQVAAALDYAHDHGFIHRDVKPANILLSADGRGGWNAKVTDFGIARAVEGTRLTATGAMVGTPEYMSPEQAQGQPVDRRSDIYSLGIVAYEMLTGRPPFRAERDTESAISVVLKHVQEVPAEPLMYNPALPPHVNYAIMKALQKTPSERFATARDFVRALAGEVQVGPQTIVVSPPSRPVSDTPTVVTAPPLSEVVRPRSNWLVPAVVISLAILGAALLIAGVLRKSRPPSPSGMAVSVSQEPFPAPVNPVPPSTVAVPTVVGLPQDQARQRLANRGLQWNVQERVHSSTVPDGHIISQNPNEGAEVEKGTLVHVVVSLGPTAEELARREQERQERLAREEQARQERLALEAAARDQIRGVIYAWKNSWERLAVDDYMGCYSSDARIYSNKKWYSYSSYYDHERELFASGGSVTITMDEPTITINGDRATVQFSMTFNRIGGKGDYTSRGRQTLKFKKTWNDEWHIYEDVFRKGR